MPCVMHTAEVGPGWTFPVIEGIINQLFTAAGWGTPQLVFSSPTATARHWYLDAWNGVVPSWDWNSAPAAEPTVLSPWARIGLHRRYYTTGNGTNVVRNENHWTHQAEAGAWSGQFTVAVADPMYFFTLSSPTFRAFSIYHREAVQSYYWAVLRDQPSDIWTPGRIPVVVSTDNFVSLANISSYAPGGSAEPMPNGVNSNQNAASNNYTLVPGENGFTHSPPNPQSPYAGLNKRVVTWNHPVFNNRIFAGYLPHDCAYIAAASLPRWGQVLTDDGKRLQLMPSSLSTALGIWITD